MKKLLIVMMAMFSLSVLASEALSVKANPPKDGTPEKVVIEYINLCLADKYKDATKLMDAKAKKRYVKSNFKYLKKAAVAMKTWDIKRLFTYKIRKIKDNEIAINITSNPKGSTSNGTIGASYKLVKIDGKWLISR